MGAQAFWVPGASQTLAKLSQSGCAQGLPMTHVMAMATGRRLESGMGILLFVSLWSIRRQL